MKRRYEPSILAMVIAGGKGERLMPLTAHRTKPAVPFGGNYRIIDFALSNFLNSGLLSIYVMVQYRSQSLIEHLRRGWRIGGRVQKNFITVVPPQMRKRGSWYEGTADAVYQNLNLILEYSPDLVAIFGADHIYRMDMNQMIDFHLSRVADVTVAALPVPIAQAKNFGIIHADPDDRIVGFDEKPKDPKPMPSDPEKAYSSMGNYLFNTDTLIRVLEQDATRAGSHDFGGDILPAIIGPNRVYSYNFLQNEIQGLQPYEEKGYWRDVGTLDAYWQAHMDLLGEYPAFDLRNPSWPILTDSLDGPAASIVRSRLDDAVVGQGSHVIDSEVRRSVIGRNVRIGNGSSIEESILLDGTIVGPKVRLKRVILDRFNVIQQGTVIGFDLKSDRKKYHVTRSGLVALPRGRSRGGRAVDVPP